MVVSFEGITYTEAKPTGSWVSESSTVVLISLILPWNTLSLMMNTCARADKHRHRHRDMMEIIFLIHILLIIIFFQMQI